MREREKQRRWTFDGSGKPHTLEYDGRVVLQDGRPMMDEITGWDESGPYARLEVHDGRVVYTLIPEKGKVRLTIEELGRKLDKALLGWLDNITT